jgi:hypothetical protein
VSWSYGNWIYNYLCNQCLSPLTLWVRIAIRRGVLDTTLCDKEHAMDLVGNLMWRPRRQVGLWCINIINTKCNFPEFNFLLQSYHSLCTKQIRLSLSSSIRMMTWARCEFESLSGEVYSIQHYVIKSMQWIWSEIWCGKESQTTTHM